MVDAIGSKFKDYAPFLLRLGLGTIFIISGVQDIMHLSSSPPLWTAAAAGLEVLCGLMVLIGWLTRWAAAGLVVLIIIQFARGPHHHAFVNPDSMRMFAYLVMSLAVYCTGGGNCSVDFRNKKKEGT